MLSHNSFSSAVFWNILFILIWDALIFFVCRTINDQAFNSDKHIFLPKTWEKNGFWYSKKLKIKKWKDLLPQYSSKNGFSKKTLSNVSLDYINEFILETCRGEWAHRKCLWISLPIFLVNRLTISLIFTFIILFINLPYICIQRYNRIRLIKLKRKLQLDS